MPSGLLNVALGLAMQVGSPGPSEAPLAPAPANAYGRYGAEGSSEQRYPFDSQRNWVHGYFQEIPAYGGHHVYRPYNYKDVLSQSQTAAGWGERPTMPYSQQFWHRYHDQATMLKTSQSAPGWTPQMMSRLAPVQGWSAAAPGSQILVPSSGTSGYSMPIQTAAPTFVPTGLAEQPQGPALQQAVEFTSPGAYRR
jgi:hypothetical protein